MTLESLVLPKALCERNSCFLWWCCRWISQFSFSGLQGWHNNSSISYVIAKISQRTGVDNIFYVCQDRRSLEKLFPTPSWVALLVVSRLSQWLPRWLALSVINFQLTSWLANLSSATLVCLHQLHSLSWCPEHLCCFMKCGLVVWMNHSRHPKLISRTTNQKACRKSSVVKMFNNSRWTVRVSSQMKMHT